MVIIMKKQEQKKLTKTELVKMLLSNNELLTNSEEELLDLLVDEPISIDIDKYSDNNMTFGDKVADKVSEIVGSWTFIILFICFLIGWIILNLYILKNGKEIDPYPFILLNLLLSCISAIQAPIIMMSQNRQNKKDSLRNHNDYKIDLKSELILEELHDKIEVILKQQKDILNKIKDK